MNMARYVLVESRDPFESRDVPYYYSLASELAAKGEDVTLFLVQNAVLAARKEIPDNPLAGVLSAKVEVVADEFSLRERGIQDTHKLDGVSAVAIDDLVDRALGEAGTKVMWH
jgi:sulfur relay (sulfurtransferase) complex TusBCD TusD component (DsrE family)